MGVNLSSIDQGDYEQGPAALQVNANWTLGEQQDAFRETTTNRLFFLRRTVAVGLVRQSLLMWRCCELGGNLLVEKEGRQNGGQACGGCGGGVRMPHSSHEPGREHHGTSATGTRELIS